MLEVRPPSSNEWSCTRTGRPCLVACWLTAYRPGFLRYFGDRLDVFEPYDVTLPTPENATGGRPTINLSQVIAFGETDLFVIRLEHSSIHDTIAYLLHLKLVYDADDRNVTLPPLGIVFPQHVLIESAEQIRCHLYSFQRKINGVRQAIDQEMVARGLPIPDWITALPRHRHELPSGLLSVDGDDHFLFSRFDCVDVVNENFCDPQRAIERDLHTIEKRYRELVEVINPATVVHWSSGVWGAKK